MFIPKISPTRSAIISMNVPYSQLIRTEDFCGIFTGTVQIKPWVHHLEIFFSDVPFSHVERILTEHGWTFEQLASVFNAMPKAYQYKKFKDYLDANMGNSFKLCS